jgi:hypothetical protein
MHEAGLKQILRAQAVNSQQSKASAKTRFAGSRPETWNP